MFNPQQQSLTGSFVGTTEILDVISQLQQTNVNTTEFKELIVRLAQIVNLSAIVLNGKISGMYLQEVFTNGSNLYSTTNNQATLRPVQTITINTGALALGMNTINLPG